METRKIYSTYEAKARLSEILRGVRERRESVLISYHGKPVAEIRPLEPTGEETLEQRIRRMEEAGIIVPGERRGSLKPGPKREGALERSLAEKDD